MDITQVFQAIFLGIVEGLTEFLPVSSTGHLIIAHNLIGFNAVPGFIFEVAIQIGSILAVCFKFRRRITVVALTLHSRPESRKFAYTILLAFLPSMVIGALSYHFIKTHLFNATVVGISLIAGGIIIIIIENIFSRVKFETVDDIDSVTALKIGFIQCLSIIPGVSRSGATIMGSVVMGVSRQAAAEFSFFLAIPTMFAATVFDLYQNWNQLHIDSLMIIAVGFIAAFIAGLAVVSTMIDFISKHGFKPFGYYRIIVGLIIISLL